MNVPDIKLRPSMKLELFKSAVMESRDGITISDHLARDRPLIFVNPAFERMTGYLEEEILNMNCRYLQSADRKQPEVDIVRRAIDKGEHCLVTLRNYRRDGSMFWNELSLSPIFGERGVVTHFIGIQKDVTARVVLDRQLREKARSLEDSANRLEQLSIKDGLTMIYNRRFFDAQFDIQWKIASRNDDALALILIDIDHFKKYNDTYGQPAGDQTLIAVARCLDNIFLRSSDFVARFGGEQFVMLSAGMTRSQATMFTRTICDRVAALQIPHAGTNIGYLTVSVGFSVRSHFSEEQQSALLKRADQSLYCAKQEGRNRAIGV